ncbi:MAG: hypothetical protein ACKV0T_30145 [Planctomycetales bacterium]
MAIRPEQWGRLGCGASVTIRIPGGGGIGADRNDRDDAGRKIQQPTYWQSVAHIGVQVASALHYAHDQGILHFEGSIPTSAVPWSDFVRRPRN